MRIALLLAVMACAAPKVEPVAVTKRPEPPPPTKPVVERGLEPAQPVLRLPKNFVATGYRARLAIDPAASGFGGEVAIAGTVSEKSSVIWLHGHHLKIKEAVATQGDPFLVPHPPGTAITVEVVGEDLLKLRAAEPLAAGSWTLWLSYDGAYDLDSTAGAFKQIVAGDPYVYSQFEATYARRAFPCIDEPDSKVPWQLTLDVPQKLVALANTGVAKETSLAGTMKRVEFHATRPLPAYLVAFGVGPFELVDAGKTRNNTPIRVVALRGRAADAAWAAETTGKLVGILEDYFGMPYPYEKLDMLTIPQTAGFGAMENAGLITFTESLILHDKPSLGQKHSWVMVASHELAHQWFGDLVTTAWWDDIWLNEGFANWMEHKVAAVFDPAGHDDIAIVEMRDDALGADALVSARKVRQPIEAQDDILTAFDGITYNKGASVLAMIETFVGPDVFQKSIRAYLEAHKWGNATVGDLATAIGETSGKPVAPAMSTFLDQPGAPVLTATCSSGTVTLAQQRYVPPGSPDVERQKPWILPACVAYEKAGKRATACTTLDGASGTLSLGKTCPRWLDANADGHGYYRVAYTAAQLTALRDEAWSQLSGPEHHDLVFNLAAGVQSGALPLQLGISIVPRLLVEPHRYALENAVGIPSGLDRLVPDELRGKYEAWMRGTFGLAMAKLGIAAGANEDLDSERERNELISAVAWLGKDPVLREQLADLAKTWRDQPAGIRGTLIAIAIDTRPAELDRFIAELHAEKKKDARGDLIGGLSATRDPKHYEKVLALLLDPTLDIKETLWMLFSNGSEANAKIAAEFYTAHEQELLKRLPQDATSFPLAYLSSVYTSNCRAEGRDAAAKAATSHFANTPGGDRIVKQNIEAMDQCIARRRILEPGVRGWLTGVKLPAPPHAEKKQKK